MAKETKVDIEALKETKGNISEEDQQAIGLEAIAEAEAEEKGQVKKKEEEQESTEKKEETGKTDEELMSAKDEDLGETELAKKKELIKAEEDTLLNAKDEDLDDEKKARKVEITKARETQATEAATKEIEAYATENKITVEEARTELESIGKIQEKYKGDPKQLARANLHLQRLFEKERLELKSLKEAKPAPQPVEISDESLIKYIEDGKLKGGGKDGKEPATRESIIEAYRNLEPDLTADMSEEAIFKLALKDIKANIVKSISEQGEKDKVKLSEDAKVKREEILTALPEADKKYLPELKPLLDKVSDAGIMAEEFNVETYVQYVKGAKYDSDVKEAEERGYKRGKEEAVIKKPGAGNPPAPKGKKTLTTEQKQRALDMYGENMSEDEAVQAYIEYLEEEEKNKK